MSVARKLQSLNAFMITSSYHITFVSTYSVDLSLRLYFFNMQLMWLLSV